MPSILERVRRGRHHDNTAPRSTATEHHTPDVDGPVPAVPDFATPKPAILEPEPTPGSATSERESGNTAAALHARSVRTRISGAWVAAIVAVVALIFLLIFILQNLSGAQVYFLGATGTLPMGVAMLFAAVAGALLIALFGSARVLQLRRAVRRHRH